MVSIIKRQKNIRRSGQPLKEEPANENSIQKTSAISRWRKITKYSLITLAGLLLIGLVIYFIWGNYLNYIVTAKSGVRAYKKQMFDYAEYLLADALKTGLSQYEKKRAASGEVAATKVWEKYQIAVTANYLGMTYLAQNKQEPLQKLYFQQIVPPLIKMYGEKSTRLINSFDILAQSLALQKDFERAEILFKETISIISKAYGQNDARLINILNHYAIMLQMAGRMEEAEKMNQEARRISAMQ